MVEKVNVWNKLTDEELNELESYNEGYKEFLSNAKTERQAHDIIVKEAKEKGFISLEDKLKEGNLKRGDKIYASNKGKMVALFVMGENLEDGMDIVGSHVDSPRIDIKANPIKENDSLLYFKTHYYGGIKKYHWVTIPLALHGVLFTKDGGKIEISIGEDEDDPIFYISDLLIHLSKDQLKKTANEVIEGEQLNIVIGHNSRNKDEDEKNPLTKNILKILKDKFGIEEEDFFRAELEAVPRGPARDVGFDRSMIAGYGHDDRVCSYANYQALFDVENPQRTAVSLIVDKEEIGSVGNTGMASKFFENTVAELLNLEEGYSDIKTRRAMANARVLSADVNVGIDPTFPEVTEAQNSGRIGSGVTLTKFTGSGGKSGSNDANAEFLAEVIKTFDDEGVIFQTGELGKVDQGGGGTIAYILAEYGAEVVDCGPAMLSMHAPIELVSKADSYETYRAYKAFLK